MSSGRTSSGGGASLTVARVRGLAVSTAPTGLSFSDAAACDPPGIVAVPGTSGRVAAPPPSAPPPGDPPLTGRPLVGPPDCPPFISGASTGRNGGPGARHTGGR